MVPSKKNDTPVRKMDLSALSEEHLLGLRISELVLRIEGTWLEDRVRQLYGELSDKGIVFRPECYLADEWLAPDKQPVVGIPFFLADPTLTKLEKKMMFEVEGSTKEWCMRLLRHETGHAINYAYRFYLRKKWKAVFGPFSAEYSDTYRIRPYSRSFVKHLERHYAQCHPDEDFAESFAVWLDPDSEWQDRYKGWKALDKLRYVDSLMSSIEGKEPPVKKGKKYWRAAGLRIKLSNYYRKKRELWAEEFPDFHDPCLERTFRSGGDLLPGSVPAAKFIRNNTRHIRDTVAFYTGERKFLIDEILQKLIKRSRELGLYAREEDEGAMISSITAYVTARIMNYVHTGQLRTWDER